MLDFGVYLVIYIKKTIFILNKSDSGTIWILYKNWFCNLFGILSKQYEINNIQDIRKNNVNKPIPSLSHHNVLSLGEDAAKIGVHLDSWILLAKLHFVVGNYSESLK